MPSPPRIWGRRDSYLTRRCGSASGESAVACAGGRAPASPAPARRPRAPDRAARAPRPALDSRWRSAPGASSPGGNNGAEAGAPEAGRGEGSVRRPGSPDPVAPLSRPGGGASRFLQPGLHLLEGAPAPRRARLQYWYRAPCGAPLGPEKSPQSPLLSRCGARSRPGKARSPQCAKQSLGPVRTLPPSAGDSPVSSARCYCTRVRFPLAAAGCRGRRTSARWSAPSAVRWRGARLALSLPPRSSPTSSSSPCSCLLGFVVPEPRPGRSPEPAEVLCALRLLFCSRVCL